MELFFFLDCFWKVKQVLGCGLQKASAGVVVQLGRGVDFRQHQGTVTRPSRGKNSVDFYFLFEGPGSQGHGWFRQERIEGINASRP